MKKKKYKERQTIEIIRPFIMAIQFIASFILMYMCMMQDYLPFGVCSIFFWWQAGWYMRFGKYINGEIKKLEQ